MKEKDIKVFIKFKKYDKKDKNYPKKVKKVVVNRQLTVPVNTTHLYIILLIIISSSSKF